MTNLDAVVGEPQELTAEEAAAVFGGARKGNRSENLKARYEAILKKLNENGSQGRRIKKIITRKNIVRLTRLKKGKYIAKYRAMAKSTRRTVTRTNFSPATSFNI